MIESTRHLATEHIQHTERRKTLGCSRISKNFIALGDIDPSDERESGCTLPLFVCQRRQMQLA